MTKENPFHGNCNFHILKELGSEEIDYSSLANFRNWCNAEIDVVPSRDLPELANYHIKDIITTYDKLLAEKIFEMALSMLPDEDGTYISYDGNTWSNRMILPAFTLAASVISAGKVVNNRIMTAECRFGEQWGYIVANVRLEDSTFIPSETLWEHYTDYLDNSK